jgi:hypothetical protein
LLSIGRLMANMWSFSGKVCGQGAKLTNVAPSLEMMFALFAS